MASKTDTVNTYSAAMKKNIKAVIITPNNYARSKAILLFIFCMGIAATMLHGVSAPVSTTCQLSILIRLSSAQMGDLVVGIGTVR
jgi:hypothetical protein